MRATGEYFSPLGPTLAMSGIGADDDLNPNGDICFKRPSRGVAIAGAVLVVGLGALAGRAMSPSPRSKTAYTVGGAVASLFGPLGIGVLGIVSLSQRR